jgi:hypothetical protein
MQNEPLVVTLDTSGDPTQEGASLDDFRRVLDGLSRAMRLMVEFLDEREMTPGQPPNRVREQSGLQIAPLKTGSLGAELTYALPDGKQLRLENYGPQALEALREWDGTDESTLPGSVTECLYETASSLGRNARLYLGSRAEPKRVPVAERRRADRSKTGTEEALLAGWLREVNWHRGTAQLHDSTGSYVSLRFDPPQADEMRRLATQYVEVQGSGRFNDQDEWITVRVEQLRETQAWSEPFDLDAFLNNPEPKIFNPDELVRIDLTDEEWEAFNQVIREGREA